MKRFLIIALTQWNPRKIKCNYNLKSKGTFSLNYKQNPRTIRIVGQNK